MFNNELMADVHFLVGQPGGTERLPGHRVRLSSRSPVTAAAVAAATINKRRVSPPNVAGLHLISVAPSHTHCAHTSAHTWNHTHARAHAAFEQFAGDSGPFVLRLSL